MLDIWVKDTQQKDCRMRQHTCIHFRQVAINTLQHVSHYRLRNWKAGRSANKLAIDLFDDNTDWQLKRMENESNERGRDIGHRIIISAQRAFNIARNHRPKRWSPWSHSLRIIINFYRLKMANLFKHFDTLLSKSFRRDRNSSQKKKKKFHPFERNVSIRKSWKNIGEKSKVGLIALVTLC